MMQSFTKLDGEGSDDFCDDFEFVDIEPENEIEGESKVLGKSNTIFADYTPASKSNSRPGSETPSTLTFPALIPNVNQHLIPTPHSKRSQTPHLESDDPPLAQPVLSLPTMSTDNVEETQKENEPPISRNPGNADSGTLGKLIKPKSPIRLDFSDVYSCKVCGTHVSREIDVESKSFQVGEGPFTEAKRGYLFRSAVNLRQGPPRPGVNFTTGIYTISYVDCFTCGQQFGWKYLGSEKTAGRAKVGKFCLKCSLLTRLDPG